LLLALLGPRVAAGVQQLEPLPRGTPRLLDCDLPVAADDAANGRARTDARAQLQRDGAGGLNAGTARR
jgi:hypothetical protein